MSITFAILNMSTSYQLQSVVYAVELERESFRTLARRWRATCSAAGAPAREPVIFNKPALCRHRDVLLMPIAIDLLTRPSRKSSFNLNLCSSRPVDILSYQALVCTNSLTKLQHRPYWADATIYSGMHLG